MRLVQVQVLQILITSVALGRGSFVRKQDNVVSIDADKGEESLGYAATRKIINVTAGDLASNSNDAVSVLNSMRQIKRLKNLVKIRQLFLEELIT